MDLRNLSSTPNQSDRRPSLSSLSSASGYASSSYGNTTPQLSNQRINQARNFLPSNSSNSNLQQWGQAPNSVAPWVEQQQSQVLKSEKDKKVLSTTAPPASNSQAHQAQQNSVGGGNGSTSKSTSNSSDVNDNEEEEEEDDELIPTAIVIKNIPFAIKKEQLLDVMTKLNLPLPYAFNYHFDNGVFRGLAFANFTSTNETSSVVNLLNGREIGGRKLRVEYKKMLPLQERERIEREKREKRGQLEEQHRSNSNASLASLMSTASTTAATKNLSVAGGNQQTERLFISLPSNPLAPPSDLNFNDPETLELYTQLVIYRDDVSKLVFELALPSTLPIQQRKILSSLVQFLGLLELYDNGLIIIRRKPGQTSRLVVSPQPPSHSSSMMNISSYNHASNNGPINGSISNNNGNVTSGPNSSITPPELLRSQSQSSIPVSTRPLAPSGSTPIQSQFPYQSSGGNSRNYQYQGQPSVNPTTTGGVSQPPIPQSSQSSTPTMGGSSTVALLRSNNRSFVDVRSTPPLQNTFIHSTESPTPQHHHFFSNGIQLPASASQQVSQPNTPIGTGDINSRFAPFGQHTHLTGSFTSLSTTQQSDEFGEVQQKFPNLNIGNGFDASGNSGSGGIWGPK